jgi:hypothetical protein
MYNIRTRLGFGNVTSFQREITKTTPYWRYPVVSLIHLNRLILLPEISLH